MPSRRLAALTTGALAAGTLSMFGLAAAPAHADESPSTISIDKSFNYSCDVDLSYVYDGVPGSLPTIPDQPVIVRAQSVVPAALYAGQTVPATPVTITLGMGRDLHFTMVGSPEVPGLGGVSADGSSSDSTLGFTVAGHRTDVPITGLSVKDSPIPQDIDDPWNIPTQGMVAPIPVPASAVGQVATLQMPQAFTADAVLHTTSDFGDLDSVLTCTFGDDNESDELLAAGQSVPITAVPITAAPSSISASAPTVAYGSTQIAYTVKNATTGTVQVLEGSKVLAQGPVNAQGRGSVKLPTLLPGRHALTLAYAGTETVLPSQGSLTVAVTKAASSITSAAITPTKIKAKKTKAKLAVRVASTAGVPTGVVTVKLKGKTVGSAVLSGGSAVVKLKKFAKKGKQALTVVYGGSTVLNGASKTVKVTVKK